MMLWRFQENDEIALTNNEAELAMREYVLWRKGSFCVWSYRGELFASASCRWWRPSSDWAAPQKWLSVMVRAFIEPVNDSV